MSKHAVSAVGVSVLSLFLSAAVDAAPILFQASGANAAAIQGTVDAFRAALGNPNNGNAPGPLVSGRREINWDGGAATATAPAGTPFAGFQNIRGALFTTPGTGFVQAVLTDLAGNPTYATTFSTFSPQRVFAPIGSNITDTTFFIPGSLQPAGVSAFGALFSDVDSAGATRMDFFGPTNNLLLSQAVLVGPAASGSQSFLGVQFNAGEVISRVRITTGNTALGPNDGGGVDVVVMDDFIYSEPQVVPEPATMALVGIGLAAAAARRRRSNGRR